MNRKQQNILILILGAIAALGPFSIDMYLPGFPAIAEDLKTDVSNVALTLTSYFIGISIGQLIYGPLLDRYGRKKPLLIGLVIYIVACAGCALSPDVFWLIGMRLLMALGGCVGMVASRAIVRDTFETREVARVFSSLILVMGVAPIIAPTVGGYVTAHLGWRYIFIILAFIAILLMVIIYRFLAESKARDAEVSLKFKDVGIGYWKVLRHPDFLVFGLAGSLAMAGLFSYIAGSPFVIMKVYGFDEQTFGWIFGLNAIGFIGGSQLNRFALRKKSTLSITYISCYLMLICGVVLGVGTVLDLLDAISFILLLFLFLFLLGFLNPNSTALALEPFAKNAGLASALIGSLRMLMGAVASSLIGILHDETALPMALIIAFSTLFTFILLIIHKSLSGKQQKLREATS